MTPTALTGAEPKPATIRELVDALTALAVAAENEANEHGHGASGDLLVQITEARNLITRANQPTA